MTVKSQTKGVYMKTVTKHFAVITAAALTGISVPQSANAFFVEQFIANKVAPNIVPPPNPRTVFIAPGIVPSIITDKVIKANPSIAPENLAINASQAISKGFDNLLKGIDNTMKRNGKELAVFGRVNTCLKTMCLSEVYRDQQIKKARAESEQQIQEALKNSRAQMEKEIRDKNTAGLKERRQDLAENLEKGKILNAEYEKGTQMLQAYLGVLESEVVLRENLRALKRPLARPNNLAPELAQQLSIVINNPSVEAMEQMNYQITVRALQLRVSIENLHFEIVRSISDKDLQTAIAQANAGLKTKIEAQSKHMALMLEMQSQYDVVDAAIKKFEGSGK